MSRKQRKMSALTFSEAREQSIQVFATVVPCQPRVAISSPGRSIIPRCTFVLVTKISVSALVSDTYIGLTAKKIADYVAGWVPTTPVFTRRSSDGRCSPDTLPSTLHYLTYIYTVIIYLRRIADGYIPGTYFLLLPTMVVCC